MTMAVEPCDGKRTSNDESLPLPPRSDDADGENVSYMRDAIARLDRTIDFRDPETSDEWTALLRVLFLADRHDLAPRPPL